MLRSSNPVAKDPATRPQLPKAAKPTSFLQPYTMNSRLSNQSISEEEEHFGSEETEDTEKSYHIPDKPEGSVFLPETWFHCYHRRT